jgi:hypothetical protein
MQVEHIVQTCVKNASYNSGHPRTPRAGEEQHYGTCQFPGGDTYLAVDCRREAEGAGAGRQERGPRCPSEALPYSRPARHRGQAAFLAYLVGNMGASRARLPTPRISPRVHARNDNDLFLDESIVNPVGKTAKKYSASLTMNNRELLRVREN